ncbi:ankyrin repeat-containing domain protein [Xylariaceae sp. FL0594]|nr:ankyrin repeat-containing domain protein [Xylariaceae sp. FL0594]
MAQHDDPESGELMVTIHDATEDGDVDQIKYLIGNRGVDVDERDNNDTALMLGASHGHRDACQVLLDNGANINARDAQNRTPLMLAIHYSQADVCKVLQDNGADMGQNRTLLHCAIETLNDYLVRLFLSRDRSLDVNDYAPGYGQPLYMALVRGAELKDDDEACRIAESLLEHGADVNSKNEDGSQTALVYACIKGLDDAVELLLDHHADTSFTGPDGMSPLALAARHKQLYIVNCLLKHDSENMKATEVVVEELRKGSDELIRAGDDATDATHTPLFYAVNGDRLDVAEVFLKEVPDGSKSILNEDMARDMTLLEMAVDAQDTEMASLLLKYGASVDRYFDGLDPKTRKGALRDVPLLKKAVENCDIEMVRLLLDHGASVDIYVKDGRNTLLSSLKEYHKELYSLLDIIPDTRPPEGDLDKP